MAEENQQLHCTCLNRTVYIVQNTRPGLAAKVFASPLCKGEESPQPVKGLRKKASFYLSTPNVARAGGHGTGRTL